MADSKSVLLASLFSWFAFSERKRVREISMFFPVRTERERVLPYEHSGIQ